MSKKSVGKVGQVSKNGSVKDPVQEVIGDYAKMAKVIGSSVSTQDIHANLRSALAAMGEVARANDDSKFRVSVSLGILVELDDMEFLFNPEKDQFTILPKKLRRFTAA